jgi:hypothetical protein
MKPVWQQKTTWAACIGFVMAITNFFIDDPAMKANLQEAMMAIVPVALIFLRQASDK